MAYPLIHKMTRNIPRGKQPVAAIRLHLQAKGGKEWAKVIKRGRITKTPSNGSRLQLPGVSRTTTQNQFIHASLSKRTNWIKLLKTGLKKSEKVGGFEWTPNHIDQSLPVEAWLLRHWNVYLKRTTLSMWRGFYCFWRDVYRSYWQGRFASQREWHQWKWWGAFSFSPL